mgnify:CR=1 FL=1
MKKPRVGIIMGSESDKPVMEKAFSILKKFHIDFDVTIASAHRTPKKVIEYSNSAERKYDLIIAGAGMAAHLPGFVASHTTLPVIGVPISSKDLLGFDALYSIVQMPPGIPVATVAINGAKNAAILAAEILSLKYPKIKGDLKRLKRSMAKGEKV